MLQDKDRIFKNLYGDESFDLPSAIKHVANYPHSR